MKMMLQSHSLNNGSAHRGGKACPCCSDYGARKSGSRERARARRNQRRVEKRELLDMLNELV